MEREREEKGELFTASINPPSFGNWFSNACGVITSQTDMARISSGESTPNCTRLTFRVSAGEYSNAILVS